MDLKSVKTIAIGILLVPDKLQKLQCRVKFQSLTLVEPEKAWQVAVDLVTARARKSPLDSVPLQLKVDVLLIVYDPN